MDQDFAPAKGRAEAQATEELVSNYVIPSACEVVPSAVAGQPRLAWTASSRAARAGCATARTVVSDRVSISWLHSTALPCSSGPS